MSNYVSIDALLDALNNQDRNAEFDAFEKPEVKAALVSLGEPAMLALIDALHRQDPARPKLQRAAAKLLDRFNDERVAPALIAALTNPACSVNVRCYAMDSLYHLKDERARETLIALLNDRDDFIRAHAASALSQLTLDARVIEPLFNAVKKANGKYHPISDLEKMVAGALRTVGEPALDRIFQETTSPLKAVRITACLALRGQTAYADRIVPVLAKAVTDSDMEVRRAAVRALHPYQDERAIMPLIQALEMGKSSAPLVQASNWFRHLFERKSKPMPNSQPGNDFLKLIRWEICDALVAIGTPAVEPLIASLQNPDVAGITQKIWALGEIGDARAVEPLRNLKFGRLRDTWLEENIEQALQRITNHDDPSFKLHIAKALRRRSPLEQ